VPIVLKSGSLSLLEPSGSAQACIGIALPYITAECGWDYTDRGKQKCSVKNVHSFHFVHHEFHLYCAGIERDPPRWSANGYPSLCVKRGLECVREEAVILLVEFAKWREVTINFAVSVFRPPLRPHGTTRLQLDGFSLNLIFQYFSKICRENQSFIKIW